MRGFGCIRRPVWALSYGLNSNYLIRTTNGRAVEDEEEWIALSLAHPSLSRSVFPLSHPAEKADFPTISRLFYSLSLSFPLSLPAKVLICCPYRQTEKSLRTRVQNFAWGMSFHVVLSTDRCIALSLMRIRKQLCEALEALPP